MRNKLRYLRNLLKKLSIENEVKNWKQDDCLKYLENHCNDKNQNTLSKQKFKIIFNRAKEELVNKKDLIGTILKNQKLKGLITNDKAVLEDILKSQNARNLILNDETVLKNIFYNMNQKIVKDGKFRKMLLADANISCEDLKTYFPNIPCDPPNKRVRVKDSGIYLWKRGYDVKEFLGAGGFGVVWKCAGENGTDIAVKVVKKDKGGPKEIENAKKLYELFKGDEQAKKYFNLLEAEKDNSPILKAVLAEGDLYKNMKDKGGLRKKNKKGENKTIDSILRNAVQALKSVIKLHERGYSHNDIKLQNFLKIDNWSGKKEKEDLKSKLQERNPEIENILKTENIDDKLEKLSTFLTTNEIKIPKIEKIKNSQNIGKEEKVKQIESIINYTMNKKSHKHRIQLADFSLVSKIPESGEGTFIKIKPNFYLSKTDLEFLGQEVDKERIEKRDVFALGRVFQLLLFRNDSSININEAVNMEKMNLNEIKNSQIYGTLKNIYQGERNDDEKGRISKFMEIIIQMLKDNYNERITLEKALQEIRTIKIEI